MIQHLLQNCFSAQAAGLNQWSKVNSILLSASSQKNAPSPKQVIKAVTNISAKRGWNVALAGDGHLLSLYSRISCSSKPTIILVEELESRVPRIGDIDGTQMYDLLQLLCVLSRDTPPIVLLATTYRREAVHEDILSRFQEELPLHQLVTESEERAERKSVVSLAKPSPAAWESLGGLHDVKRQLLQHLDLTLRETPSLAMTNDDVILRVPAGVRIEAAKGVVLYGRPGTGKTMLVKALAELRGVPLQSISLAELLASDVGEAERHLREAFSVEPPHLIFVDELQAIFVKRGEERSHAQMLTTQFFLLLDALPKGIMVVGATNVPSLLDESLLGGRLILLEVPPPSSSDRLSIFRSIVSKMPLAPDVDVASVSAACPVGTTGAEVHFVCRTAAMAAISVNSRTVSAQHFMFAVQELKARGGRD